MLIYAQMANFSLVAYFVSIDTATSIRIKAIYNRTILLAENHHVVGSCTPLLFSFLLGPRVSSESIRLVAVSYCQRFYRIQRFAQINNFGK